MSGVNAEVNSAQHDPPMLEFIEEDNHLAYSMPDRPKKTRKRKSHVLDSVIEINSVTLKTWQSQYLSHMRMQTSKRSRSNVKHLTSQNAVFCVYDFRTPIRHPTLRLLFVERHNPNSPRMTLGQRASPEADKLSKSQVEVPLVTNLAMGEDVDDVELGRQLSAEEQDSLERESTLPWNMSREASQARSVSGTGLRMYPASIQSTPRRFSFLPTPVLPSRPVSAQSHGRSNLVSFELDHADKIFPHGR